MAFISGYPTQGTSKMDMVDQQIMPQPSQIDQRVHALFHSLPEHERTDGAWKVIRHFFWIEPHLEFIFSAIPREKFDLELMDAFVKLLSIDPCNGEPLMFVERPIGYINEIFYTLHNIPNLEKRIEGVKLVAQRCNMLCYDYREGLLTHFANIQTRNCDEIIRLLDKKVEHYRASMERYYGQVADLVSSKSGSDMDSDGDQACM